MYPSPPTASFHPKEGKASVVVEGKTLEMVCRENRSAQRYRAVYRDGSLILTIPSGQSRRQVEEALVQMGRQLVEYHQKAEAKSQAARSAPLTLWGQPLTVKVVRPDGLLKAHLSGSELRLSGVQSEAEGRALAACWMVQEADRCLPEMLMERAKEMGKTVRKISIRDMASKWGSCTSAGVVSLNFRLVMAPREVADYLVVHELAHLTEMNHSPRFWALVEKHCPGSKELDRWLTRHGHDLMAALPRVHASRARGINLEEGSALQASNGNALDEQPLGEEEEDNDGSHHDG
jgi:predicted metal-dependent hydrolase